MQYSKSGVPCRGGEKALDASQLKLKEGMGYWEGQLKFIWIQVS